MGPKCKTWKQRVNFNAVLLLSFHQTQKYSRTGTRKAKLSFPLNYSSLKTYHSEVHDYDGDHDKGQRQNETVYAHRRVGGEGTGEHVGEQVKLITDEEPGGAELNRAQEVTKIKQEISNTEDSTKTHKHRDRRQNTELYKSHTMGSEN